MTRGGEAVLTLSGFLFQSKPRNGEASKAGRGTRSGELVTTRCQRIAHGVPFLREGRVIPFGLELTPSFEVADVAARELCQQALGPRFHLPERAELVDLAEQGVLPFGDWFYFEPGVGHGALEYRAPITIGFETPPPEVRLVPDAPEAMVACIASGIVTAADPPTDEEVRACVTKVGRYTERLGLGASSVPVSEIDLVLEVRRACERKDAAAWPTVVRRLEARRDELPKSTESETLGALQEQVVTFVDARSFATEDRRACAELRALFDENCGENDVVAASGCLGISVAHAVRCAGDRSALVLLETSLDEVERRFRALRAENGVRELVGELTHCALRCVEALPTSAQKSAQKQPLQRLADSLRGPRGPDSARGAPVPFVFSACGCKLEDYRCGIAAVAHHEHCLGGGPLPDDERD